MNQENLLSERILKLLLLISIAQKIEGKTKLQKIVFLGKEEEDIDLGFEFVKYNYGPYSFELTKELESLQTLGLIEIQMEINNSTDSNGFISKKFIYKITTKGNEIINSETEKLKEVVEKIKQLVRKWNTVPREKIVEHVYSRYM